MAQEEKTVRKYRPELEKDFDWVTRNPEGKELAFCKACEISITPTISCLATHAASTRHQGNIYSIKKTGQKIPPKPKDLPKPSSWKKEYDQSRKFRDEWLTTYPWVQKKDRLGYCPYCDIELEPRAKRLEDHQETVKHQRNVGQPVVTPEVKKTKTKKMKKSKSNEKEKDMSFDKINDISELMEELPTLLEGEDASREGQGCLSNTIPTLVGDQIKVEEVKLEPVATPYRKSGRQRKRKKMFDEDDDEWTTTTTTPTKRAKQKEPHTIAGSPSRVYDDEMISDLEGDGDNGNNEIVKSPVNKWAVAFPWVVMFDNEDNVPFCPHCEMHVDPTFAALKRHEELRKHKKNTTSKEQEEKSKVDSGVQSKDEISAVKESSENESTTIPIRRQTAKVSMKSQQEEDPHETVTTTLVQDLSTVRVINSATPIEIEVMMPQGGEVEDEEPSQEVSLPNYVNIIISPDGQTTEMSSETHFTNTIEVTESGEIVHRLEDGNAIEIGHVEEDGANLLENETHYIMKSEPDDLEDQDDPDFSPEKDESANTSTNVSRSGRRRYTKRDPNQPKSSSWKREYEKSRRFQPEWLDEFPWVRKNESKAGGESAYCPYCNVSLDSRVVRLRQHESTSKHKKNASIHSKRVLEEEALVYEVVPKTKDGTEVEVKTSISKTPKKSEIRPRYKCDLCNQRFVAQRNLFFHLKEHYEPESKLDRASSPPPPDYDDDETAADQQQPAVKYEYNPMWERIFPWLQKAVDDDWAFCCLCNFPMEPKLSIIKTHVKHRRHLKLVSQQSDPGFFEQKSDVHGILAEEEKKESKKRNSATGNADLVMDDDGKQKYQCKICKKVLVKTSFAVHLRIHQGLRPYKCTMCDWAFKQAYDLKHHVESIHDGIKAHQCELCGKEFTRKYTLRLHQKSHTDTRDFKCQICQRGFYTKGKLIEHGRTHTGEKPFLCDVCGRGFRIKYDMVQHRLKTHFGIPAKRRKNRLANTEETLTTAFITTKDDLGIEESVEVELEEHQVHTIHTVHTVEEVESVMQHQPKHQLVFISENEAVFLPR